MMRETGEAYIIVEIKPEAFCKRFWSVGLAFILKGLRAFANILFYYCLDTVPPAWQRLFGTVSYKTANLALKFWEKDLEVGQRIPCQ